MKILSSFTFTLTQQFLLLSTKEDILKNVGNQKQLMLAIVFHSIFFHIVEVNGYRQLSGYQHSSKYLLGAQ